MPLSLPNAVLNPNEVISLPSCEKGLIHCPSQRSLARGPFPAEQKQRLISPHYDQLCSLQSPSLCILSIVRVHANRLSIENRQR